MQQKAGFIAIIGRPNSGKSTLLNTVLKSEISIVTPKAQTTRDQVLGILTEEKQGQIVFIDTPGIHRAREGGLNQYMVRQASLALEAPHIVWYLVDPASGIDHEQAVIELLERARLEVPLFLLINKTDTPESWIPLSTREKLENAITAALTAKGIKLTKTFRISALKGTGIEDLLAESWNLIPENPPYYPDPDQLSDRPTRFFVAEKIREQLFHCLGEELPYACAVEITQFKEDSVPPRIEATIHVERDSQKGMVIGDRGHKIKEIGQAARQEIEKFLGQKIFLGLKVNLLKNWSKDAETLRKMGYDVPTRGKKK